MNGGNQGRGVECLGTINHGLFVRHILRDSFQLCNAGCDAMTQHNQDLHHGIWCAMPDNVDDSDYHEVMGGQFVSDSACCLVFLRSGCSCLVVGQSFRAV